MRQRAALFDSLLRALRMEIAPNVLPEHSPQVLFTKDNDVVETLSSIVTEKSFAHCVHSKGAGSDLKHWCSHLR